MAENNNAQSGRVKEVRITGAMVASLVGIVPQVSRLEEKLINMSMSASPAMRTQVNNLTDRFQRALRGFEDELRSASKDAEVDGRRSQGSARNRRRPAAGSAAVATQAPGKKTPAAQPQGQAAAPSKQPNEGQKAPKGNTQQAQPKAQPAEKAPKNGAAAEQQKAGSDSASKQGKANTAEAKPRAGEQQTKGKPSSEKSVAAAAPAAEAAEAKVAIPTI